ncbi:MULTISPECIES: hypothetical protein [Hymenobacter]|uniref:PorT family protein n=1 Tax=Hymenobacter jejuensis TaxID=2502781 RepID=A0A5B7ZYZ9_9BACT|nr:MULTISPECIES: hypothetical protein [Hymenobacter]MBC6991192.1 hypothetical protein [Hymenobacter sp. BT491]QDA60434.1 hypothetical protein FHG12_10070 [Hymenobacter jejuensis]
MRTYLTSGFFLLATLGAGTVARAQGTTSSDEPSYRKEFTYGVNFNTQGGLIGGVAVRSTHVLSQDWARFWSIEGVEVKHPKEQKVVNPNTGGTFVIGKSNYLFVLRPSFGAQRVIFRKAPESGVQVNALAGAGPSIGLLMPYYIYYDYTQRDPNGRPLTSEDIRAEQYDPFKHSNGSLIVDRAPLFSGAGEFKANIGAHVRGALSFEYGRYRDAVAGIETGFLFEMYPNRLTILRANTVPDSKLNNRFFPSVYLTLYLGHRS